MRFGVLSFETSEPRGVDRTCTDAFELHSTLYSLSHDSMNVVEMGGIEPPTPAMPSLRSPS